MISLNELARNSLLTAERRERNGASIRTDTLSMLKHCAGEVVEATEAYKAYKDSETVMQGLNGRKESFYDKDEKEAFAAELADVICCVLIISGKEDIDIAAALSQCMGRNAERIFGQGDKL